MYYIAAFLLFVTINVGFSYLSVNSLGFFSGYKDSKGFSWEKYLEETDSQAAPARAFKLVGESLWLSLIRREGEAAVICSFLLDALFDGGSPRLCEEGETGFFTLSLSLRSSLAVAKTKHTADYKTGLRSSCRLNIKMVLSTLGAQAFVSYIRVQCIYLEAHCEQKQHKSL